ncbi:MAG: histidine kinase dimerization/phospho-acceptor domain-containing protein [Desulfobacterales bacterium]|nr:histidine kinase dimerization/phospho-acceptor domain-containing protein [Desulfobacterales bacterium]
MNTWNRLDERLNRPAKEDLQSGCLVHQLSMAHEINRHARSLLHADTQSDAATATLDNLRKITGINALLIFKKHTGADGGVALEWCCQTRNGAACEGEWKLYQPDSEACERLAIKKSVRIAWSPAADAGSRDIPREGQPSGLIIPINVFGTWWGGLCLDCGVEEIGDETPVFESLVTTADFLGVFFERQIASREHTESDKLAGALEMAGTVCHKLNQPMQVILGYASMVTSGDISDPDQVCDIVKMIEDETRRMGIITKNLMGITKYRTVETPEVGSMCDVDSSVALR